MLIYSQLKVASLENLSTDPSLLPLGRVYLDTVLDRPKIKISSGVKQLLFKDDPVIIGTNATSSTNVKLHRAGTGIAQAVLGNDATAEGSQATTLAQFGFRPQSFTDAGKPTFGQVGRIIWVSDLTKLQYDNGSTWVDVGSLANPMTTGGDLIYGGSGGTATRLANGTAGQVLQSGGGTAAPSWTSSPSLVSPVVSTLLDLTAGQIKFPATQVPSTDVNTLDDYEEGTFTPTIIGTSTAGTGTYSIQNGFYTKIGRKVDFKIFLSWSAHTGTGNMRVSGLPFTSINATYGYSTFASYVNGMNSMSAGNILQTYMADNVSVIVLEQYAPATSGSSPVPMDTNVSTLIISGSYYV